MKLRTKIAAVLAVVALALTGVSATPSEASPGYWKCSTHTYLAQGGPVIMYGGNHTTEWHQYWYELYPYRYTRVYYQTQPGGTLYYYSSYNILISSCY